MDGGDCGRTHSPIMQGMAGMTGPEEREYFREWDESMQKRKNAVPEEPISALSFDDEEITGYHVTGEPVHRKPFLDKESDFVKSQELKEPEFHAPFAIANPKTYRKLPIEVQGLKWTGTNVHEMRDFVGKRGARNSQDPETGVWLGSSGEWNFLTPVEISGIMESSAIVWDSVQRGWIPVNIGDTILKGVSGEFYPISEDVLRKTYEEVK
jgi:hypothetical protein